MSLLPLSLSPLPFLSKVLGISLAAALVAVTVLGLLLANAKEVIQGLTVWQDEMVTTIRLASGNNEVNVNTAKGQVQALGTSLATLHSALKQSNDAVDRLGEATRTAQAEAERQAGLRRAAIARAEQLARQLRADLEPVPAEEMEAEVRRVQDLAYESGL